jgi:dolichyl-diphosphooligosaccharide--protein glycosyltransferase/undecaprenyl-diphosphooligosaccharide--protein glycosyltransferase
MDERYADSLFIRSYYYDDYDRELFEPVIESPWMKVLKLK